MPTPEETQAKLDAKLGGGTAAQPGGTRINVAGKPAAAPKKGRLSQFLDIAGAGALAANPLTQGVAIKQAVDKALGRGGDKSLRAQNKTSLKAAFSGREYLKSFDIDLDKADIPLVSGRGEDLVKTAIDAVVNPASAASAIAAPVRLPAMLAAKPLGRLAARIGIETGLGVAGAEVAEQTFDAIPETAPNWVKIVAPMGAAIATTGGATAGVNRVANLGVRQGINTAADAIGSSARGAGGQYLAPLAELEDLRAAFPKPSSTGVGRVLASQYDPVKAEITDAGEYLRAYERQTRVAVAAAKFSLAKALPNGLSAFKVGADDTIENLRDAYGKRLGTDVHWNDVLSDADAPAKYNFTNKQIDQWDAVRKLIDEVPEFASSYGLDWAVRDVDGKVYFPRQVRGAPPGTYERPSDPNMLRLHEDATEAARGGVTYAGPDQTLAFHVESVYRAVARQQFSDVVEKMSVLPSSAYVKTARGAKNLAAHRTALKAYNNAKSGLASAQRKAQRLDARLWEASRAGGTGARRAQLFNQLDQARKDVEAAKGTLKTTRVAKDKARSARNADFDSYRKSTFTKVPSKLFGRGGDENIPVDLWQGRFMPKADVNRLIDWADPITGMIKDKSPHPFVHTIGEIGGLQRTLSATMDLGVLFLQMLPLLATNPVGWGRAATTSVEALMFPGTINRYLASNADSIQEMIVSGRVPMGDVEFFTSLQGQSLGKRALSTALSPFERQYNAGLLAARHEYWKALKPVANMSDEKLGGLIRNLTGGMDTAALGINHSQRALESLVLFAPALLRATGALYVKAMKPWTPDGAEAAHALMKTMGATAAIFSLATLAQANSEGLSQAETDERLRDVLNPLGGKKFLSVKIGDGYHGVGGTVRATSQMLMNTIGGGINFLEDGTIDGAEDNPLIPLIQFMGDRNAPAYKDMLGIAELATGEKLNLLPFDHIDDVPDLLKFIGSGSLPFLVQEAIDAGLDPLRPLDADPMTTTMLGGRYSPLSPSELRDQQTNERYGLDYIKLSPQEKTEFNTSNPQFKDAIKNFASREERAYQSEVDRINETATVTLQAIARNMQAGAYSDRAKMREDVEDTMTARAIGHNQNRHSFGKDFADLEDTETSQVLDAYYETFKGARLNPDDENSPINFEVLEQLQATFNRQVSNGLFGSVSRAQEVLSERTGFQPPPELAQFFANKAYVQKAGYWDEKDRAFRELARDIKSDRTFATIESAGELAAKALQLENAGDIDGAAYAKGWLRAIDRVAGAQHRLMRIQDPKLDRALLQNGYTSKRLTEDSPGDETAEEE